MKIRFFKYQGTGNDFIILDDRTTNIDLTQSIIAKLCDRKFGIGADGLMLLKNHDQFNFEMIYYNSDGKTSSMCGNGGRCIALFAKHLGLVQYECVFQAIDGVHHAKINENSISLKMNNITKWEFREDTLVVDTGSPHFVYHKREVENEEDFIKEARSIRNSSRFIIEGINVNLVEEMDGDVMKLRTYERGVENETLSCGTGAVAAAIFNVLYNNVKEKEVKTIIQTRGGELTVLLTKLQGEIIDVWLEGPAKLVFKGEIEL